MAYHVYYDQRDNMDMNAPPLDFESPHVIDLPVPVVETDLWDRSRITFSSNSVGGPRIVTFDESLPPIVYDTAPQLAANPYYSGRSRLQRTGSARFRSHSPPRNSMYSRPAFRREYDDYEHQYNYGSRGGYYQTPSHLAALTRAPVRTREYEPDILYSTTPVADTVNLENFYANHGHSVKNYY